MDVRACVPRAAPVRPGRRLRGCTLTLLLFLQLPSKNRFDFVSFKTKKLWGEPILRSQLQTVTEASCWPRSSISIVRNEVQSRLSTYSLRQLRLGFELQPPPLSDTTLAERLPLRVPVIHDYAQRSTTESSTHGRRHGTCASQP